MIEANLTKGTLHKLILTYVTTGQMLLKHLVSASKCSGWRKTWPGNRVAIQPSNLQPNQPNNQSTNQGQRLLKPKPLYIFYTLWWYFPKVHNPHPWLLHLLTSFFFPTLSFFSSPYPRAAERTLPTWTLFYKIFYNVASYDNVNVCFSSFIYDKLHFEFSFLSIVWFILFFFINCWGKYLYKTRYDPNSILRREYLKVEMIVDNTRIVNKRTIS